MKIPILLMIVLMFNENSLITSNDYEIQSNIPIIKSTILLPEEGILKIKIMSEKILYYKIFISPTGTGSFSEGKLISEGKSSKNKYVISYKFKGTDILEHLTILGYTSSKPTQIEDLRLTYNLFSK